MHVPQEDPSAAQHSAIGLEVLRDVYASEFDSTNVGMMGSNLQKEVPAMEAAGVSSRLVKSHVSLRIQVSTREPSCMGK